MATTIQSPSGGLAEHIGTHMRAARAAHELTLSQTSRRLGVHLNTVHRLEKGRGTIMLTQIERVLAAFDLELAVVPLGHRREVEGWAGWADPDLAEQARRCCGTVDEQALIRHAQRNCTAEN